MFNYKKNILKRLKFEVACLREELEEIRPLFEQACGLFSSKITAYCTDHNLPNPLDEFEPEEKNSAEALDHPFKVIFRQIALRTHPDKYPGEEDGPFRKNYIEATKAKEEADVFELFGIASDLKIDTSELTFNEIDSLREAIKKKREEISNIYNSIVFKWHYANNKAKDKFVKTFIECNIKE